VNNGHVYCVILAGGVGERLWPLSRQSNPKQLLEVHGNKTLLDQAIDRVELLVPRENILISTTQFHQQKMKDLFGNRIGGIIVEPGLRNTGPAILLSCLQLYEKDKDATIVFLPADPFIPQKDNDKFAQFVEHAIDFSNQHSQITLLGVKPTFAATGYGYIEFDSAAIEQPSMVKKFHEKPNRDVAQTYFDSGSMLWNIGIFCAKASVFLDQYKSLAPKMFSEVMDYRAGLMDYNHVQSDSIDYAIMEKSNQVSVLPVDFSWCDVGDIEVFLTIKDNSGSLQNNGIIQTAAKNNLVNVPNKLVALIGVDDLCIVETDEVLLITKREDAQKVRDIVKQIKKDGLNNYL